MSRYDLSKEQLAELTGDLPAYRSKQIWDGLYRRQLDIGDMTDLPKDLRAKLSDSPEFASALRLEKEVDADNKETVKWLFRLHDDAVIESVLMHHPRHSTVCVSSQAGCAMACTFCATGDGGFQRQLSTGEIVEQVINAARAATTHERRLDHVVFMGMGEPLANYNNVIGAIEHIIDDIGLGARHITVSTVGVVPGIVKLTNYDRQINLAVSLHAANNELRNELVPLNKRYPIEKLIEACATYVRTTHRRLSFEWAMINGVNDRMSDAEELAEIAYALKAHVNLIPLNPTVGGSLRGYLGSPASHVKVFRDELIDRGVNATIRRTRGQEIDAACGQLAGTATSSVQLSATKSH